MTTRVSVVVPTFNRPELLDRCLAALAGQDLDPRAYEVIVVDDATCVATRRQVEGWAERARSAVRYVAVTEAHGPAAARNAGWRAARSDLIAFTDDDTVPDRGWLGAGLTAFSDGVSAVAGRVVMPLPRVPTDYQRNEAGLERAEFVTANCFVRRAALAAVGGFDERFTAAWREDSDLYFTLLKRNWRVVQAPTAVVVHPIRPARWGVSLDQQWKSRFNALLYKKHPRLYSERIQPTPPWHYYRIVLSLLVALLGALGRRPSAALAAVTAWLLLTARFCWQRLRGTSHSPSHVAEMLVTSALIPPLSVYWRLRGALTFRVVFL
jgi:glycosyltransferase involved in cell wall biosynthesis